MATDDGGAAYPCPINVEDPESSNPLVIESAGGMTLLDHFAGLAMQAYIATCLEQADDQDHAERILRDASKCAYELAGGMIEEKRRLEKETTP